MLFNQYLTIIRGGGDLGTGVAYRLHRAGFPLIVLELAHPLVVRRSVALASAVLEGEVIIEELHGRLVETAEDAEQLTYEGGLPVLIAPDLTQVIQRLSRPIYAIVDARLAKRNIDTDIKQAPLVIGLGPGFTAGLDCHAVVETKRGHTLGRVMWDGPALPNTGTPGVIAGKGAERVLRAAADGHVVWEHNIGIAVKQNQRIGSVAGVPVLAPFDGVIRGLIAQGTQVNIGMKIGDVDARADISACFTISDKALSIGGGVLEALLSHMSRHRVNGLDG